MKKTIIVPVSTIILAAILLLGSSFGLKEIAAANAQSEHLWIMQTILPGSTEFVVETYTGEDTNIRSVHKGETGFVIETVTYGYAGDITMLIGVSKEGTVTGLVVRDMSETFSLGAEALTDHEFLAQYLNTAGEAEVGTTVDAISGATVTSKAITRSVNSAVAYVTGADVGSGATSCFGRDIGHCIVCGCAGPYLCTCRYNTAVGYSCHGTDFIICPAGRSLSGTRCRTLLSLYCAACCCNFWFTALCRLLCGGTGSGEIRGNRRRDLYSYLMAVSLYSRASVHRTGCKSGTCAQCLWTVSGIAVFCRMDLIDCLTKMQKLYII